MMKQIFKLWPLLLIVGCSSLSNEPEKISEDVTFASTVGQEVDHFRIGNGDFCKRNGNIGTCGFVSYISSGQVKVVCKNSNAETTATARSYKIQDDFHFSPEIKGYIFKECAAEFKILYVDHNSYIPIMLNPNDEEKLKQPQTEWSFKLTDVENKSTYVAKYETQLASEAQDKILTAQKKVQDGKDAENARLEEEKRRNQLKKNWSQKNYQGNAIHFSKKDALMVSEYVGRMGWLDANMNCRNQGLRLPTLDEMESLSSSGLCAVVIDNCELPLWTITSRHNDKNAQRNMIVGNGAWAWAEANGQGIPTSLSSENGVICVR